MKKIIPVSVIIATFLFSGCFETVSRHAYFSSRLTESYLRSRCLPFLETGISTREKIEEKLGLPSSVFENGRIYVYRLIINEWEKGLSEDAYSRYNLNRPPDEILESDAKKRFEKIDSDGALLVIRGDNIEQYEKEIISSIGEFHLVLVFSMEGTLSRDSLIRIRP
jgi:hypothetical protein